MGEIAEVQNGVAPGGWSRVRAVVSIRRAETHARVVNRLTAPRKQKRLVPSAISTRFSRIDARQGWEKLPVHMVRQCLADASGVLILRPFRTHISAIPATPGIAHCAASLGRSRVAWEVEEPMYVGGSV